MVLRGVLLALPLLLGACTPEATLAITFGGDVFLAREGEALFKENPWGGFAPVACPEDQGPCQSLFFANLESPLGERKTTTQDAGYNLCAGVDQITWLTAGSLDLVSLANNHRSDCANEESTRTILEKAGILYTAADFQPFFLNTVAGRVAVIAAEDITAPIDEKYLFQSIAEARAVSDILIVSMHWGMEYQAGPAERQKLLAQKLADAGVDVLWGHHPHVLQPIKWVSDSHGQHQMLTMFSLGNLIADQWMLPAAQRSALITLTFRNKEIIGLSVEPVLMDQTGNSLISPNQEDRQIIWESLNLQGEIGANRITPEVVP